MLPNIDTRTVIVTDPLGYYPIPPASRLIATGGYVHDWILESLHAPDLSVPAYVKSQYGYGPLWSIKDLTLHPNGVLESGFEEEHDLYPYYYILLRRSETEPPDMVIVYPHAIFAFLAPGKEPSQAFITRID